MADTLPAIVYPMPGDGNGPNDIKLHWGSEKGGSDIFPKTKNQPVVSMVAGKVISTTTQAQAPLTGGNSVLIQASNGLQYYYAHLANAPSVAAGQVVKAGQQLGIAGDTGDAKGKGIHLHIGIGYGIIDGTDATGGLGKKFDAVSYLKSVVKTGNIPSLATKDGQDALASGQLQPGIADPLPLLDKPASTSIEDKIKWLGQLLFAAGLDKAKIPEMVAIALAENHPVDPNAGPNATGDYGLFQINCPTWVNGSGGNKLAQFGVNSCEDLKDPFKNAQAAVYILGVQGLNAWTTHKIGVDAANLPQVNRVLGDGTYTTGLTQGSGANTGDGTGNDGGDSTSGADPCISGCGQWELGSLAGQSLHIPDLGCVAGCTMTKFVTDTKDRWNEWIKSETDKWYLLGAVIIGGLIIMVGLLQTNQGQTLVQNVGTAAKGAAMMA